MASSRAADVSSMEQELCIQEMNTMGRYTQNKKLLFEDKLFSIAIPLFFLVTLAYVCAGDDIVLHMKGLYLLSRTSVSGLFPGV